MSKFALTAQLQLQAPRNTNQVINQLKRDLQRGATINVEVKGAAQAQKQIKAVTKETKKATNEADRLGKAVGAAFKRYVAFAAAGRALSFAGRLGSAIEEAVQFERELVKISQVTGKTTKELQGLQKTVTSLSTTLGVTSAEILGIGRVLSQAGIKANELDVALSALAKTALAPTFTDITKTTEGAIAILSQFGNGVKNLQRDLSAINAVAGQFAVESDDLIDGVRRFGGVFKSAGGSIEELLGLITSIRATTRESAESINTGLRTIFTRLQRPKTIQYLEELGVSLKTAEGAFVGPFEAVKRLNKAFANLPAGSTQFIQIAEELGGFRQIGKVIPLLQQFEIAERARQAAVAGGNSLNEDAAKAQEALAVKIVKVKEEFLALVRSFTQDTTFKFLVDQTLAFASALIKVADAIRPIVPLLGALALPRALSFGAGAFSNLTGGFTKKNTGGKILGFNKGGYVPGAGNRDTVPAMLTPGEFVIKKSSVQSLGAGTLEAMNNNRYARGGLVVRKTQNDQYAGLFARPKGEDKSGRPITIPAKDGDKVGSKSVLAIAGAPKSYFISGADEDAFTNKAKSALTRGINEATSKLTVDKKKINKVNKNILADIGVADVAGKIFEGVTRTIIGDKRKGGGAQQGFDIPRGLSKDKLFELSNLFAQEDGLPDIDYDNKLTENPKNRASLVKKASNDKLFDDPINVASFALTKTTKELVAEGLGKPKSEDRPKKVKALRNRLQELDAAKERSFGLGEDGDKLIKDRLQKERKLILGMKGADTVGLLKRNTGGSVPHSQDTVPAMLTPGEFVINAKSAKKIGYANLRSMNSKGVKGFNKGGAVGVQGFNTGGVVGGGLAISAGLQAFSMLQSKIDSLGKVTDEMTIAQKEAATQAYKWGASLKRGQTAVIQLAALFIALRKANKGIDAWTNAVAKSSQVASSESAEQGKDKEDKAVKDNTAAVKKNTAAIIRGQGSESKKSNAPAEGSNVSARPSKERRKELRRQAEGKLGAKGPTERGGDASKGVAAVERKITEQRKKINIASNKLTNSENKLIAAQAKLNAQSKDASGQFRKQTDAEKASNKVLRNRIAILKASIPEQKRALTTEISKRQALQATYTSLNKTITTNQKEVDKLETKYKDVTKAKQREERITARNAAKIKQNSTLMGRFTYAMSKSNTATGKAKKALQQFGIEIDRVRKKARRGLGVGGGLRRGVGAVGRGATAVGGAVVGGAIIAQAVAGAISDISNRQRDLAIERGDAGRAAGAARTGAISEEAGRLFTLSGIGELFTLSKEERAQSRKQRIGRATADAAASAATSNASSLLEQRREDVKRGQGGSVTELAGKAGKEFGTAAKTIEDQFKKGNISKKFRDEQLRNLKGSSNEIAQEIGKTAKSATELDAAIKLLSGGSQKLYTANIEAARSAFALKQAQEATSKAQFETLQLSSTFAAANSAVDTFLNQIQSGADPLNAFIANVEAGANAIGVDSRNSIDKLEKSLLQSVQGTGLEGAVRNQADTARAANDFSLSVGKRLANLDLGVDPGKREAQIKEALFSGLGTDETGQAIRQQVSAVLAGADFENLNLSEIIKKVQTNVNGLSAGLLQSAKLQAAHNAKMSSLYKQREALENKAAASQIKAIDTQLEAAKIFESAGGAKLTPQQQSQARVAQFNQLGSLAGVSLGGGSAADIQRANQQISQSFFAQQQQDIVSRNAVAGGGTAAFAGPQGVEKDRRPELVAAQAQLINTTKQQIAIRQEELKIIQQKNAAEKSALDKLISGDVEGFIKGQEAAGAAAALETGDKNLASLFGASALGEGFKALQARGDATAASAEATLQAFGITDKSSAGVLAGKSPEQEALNAEIRNLAVVLGDIAQEQASFDRSNLEISTATIKITQAQFEDGIQQAAGNVQGRWMGGTIYASKGAFIPRGTDTVPAMLTPGEFVVNRRAVQTGNNLQVLKAMNSGAGAGASGQGGMNGGGSVGYYQFGGVVEAISSAFGGGVNGLMSAFGNFNQAVEKLSNLTLTLNIPDTNIRVSVDALNVSSLRDQVVSEVMDKVGREISSTKINNTGDLTKATSILPKIA